MTNRYYGKEQLVTLNVHVSVIASAKDFRMHSLLPPAGEGYIRLKAFLS